MCRVINQQAVCSCIPGFIGSPPTCRPECITSSECLLNQACSNQKCIDPCPGSCGLNAVCQIVNHHPICSCKPGDTGDPFVRCTLIGNKPNSTLTEFINKVNVVEEIPVRPQENPCQPSPCGFNSQCKVVGDSPSCSCLPNFLGTPPNCRPECVSNSECENHLACINQKCQDPCVEMCGVNAECRVVSHTPNCACVVGFFGDPFTQCLPEQSKATSVPCRKL